MSQDVKPVYLDTDEVARFVSLSKVSVQKLVREGTFPKPRKISAHRVAYLTAEVEEWARGCPVSDMLPPPNGGGHRKVTAPPVPQDGRKVSKAT
jgi:prophage regulatory protein